jgi:hypothetical protein
MKLSAIGRERGSSLGLIATCSMTGFREQVVIVPPEIRDKTGS